MLHKNFFFIGILSAPVADCGHVSHLLASQLFKLVVTFLAVIWFLPHHPRNLMVMRNRNGPVEDSESVALNAPNADR